jgi:hypothetical protein
MKALVIPTIRESSIKCFLESWRPVKDWDVVILVEDNPQKTFDIDVDHHFCWSDIDTDLGGDSWIISRRDSAIRSYGFYKAYQMGADYIFTLDDDCLPTRDRSYFCDEHIKNLEKTPKWCESVLGYRTRGLPYENFGLMKNVKFSMGLWEGIPDFDAINMLSNSSNQIQLTPNRIIPKGQYFPFCGMNFAFKRDVTPLTFFALMGYNTPFGRFDDIWFGIICKKICDHLDFSISCGTPHIYHSKASNAFDNLVKEAPGIKMNEHFWEAIDNIELQKNTPISCMEEIGVALSEHDDAYMKKLGKAVVLWAKLF